MNRIALIGGGLGLAALAALVALFNMNIGGNVPDGNYGPGSGEYVDNQGPGSGEYVDNQGPGSGEYAVEPTGPDSSYGPGSGEYVDNQGPGSGEYVDNQGPGSGEYADPEGPGSGEELPGVYSSCNVIAGGSTCVDYVGPYYSNSEFAQLNCGTAGAWSTTPCPTGAVGGCNAGLGSEVESIAWFYGYGGAPYTAEVLPSAVAVCNANPIATWIPG